MSEDIFAGSDDKDDLTALTDEEEFTSLAEVAIRQGEYERATAFEEQSLEIRREVGEPWGIAVSLGNFGWIALLQGDLKQAVTLLPL